MIPIQVIGKWKLDFIQGYFPTVAFQKNFTKLCGDYTDFLHNSLYSLYICLGVASHHFRKWSSFSLPLIVFSTIRQQKATQQALIPLTIHHLSVAHPWLYQALLQTAGHSLAEQGNGRKSTTQQRGIQELHFLFAIFTTCSLIVHKYIFLVPPNFAPWLGFLFFIWQTQAW